MSKSLRDQLLGAGIASKKQHQQARTQKKKQKKQGVDPQVEQRRRLEEEKRKQVERDKALNQQREAERKEKEKLAQIRQIVTTNKVERKDGESTYSFVDNKKIKKWYLDDKQIDELSKGRLSLVRLEEEDYVLISGKVAEKLAERLGEEADQFLLVNNKGKQEEIDEDDPYADYQIPDDLMW
ncbi:DUF2058 domain-containing protein [Sansalvadorimonas sp. 2012CJ34-2]|uniref:DUF2058 domain-containing protein n=1 Tax=Parendozoicomonas callyspongiae TaxID=2942213 RepID=A0ABT0PF72_9GAMM|nr:DUF2058 domain-containing protein [Sansalvadorimonas sp. 2012CJ34-2]MCL6269390.1 DUF2058 domain-containing protein [Sansalvadorimonas sp. 2012CJ34-2]MCL6269422.1 DUF2058 domain-containing protein [Sansalvadorimonas sp. 2012CJ34-2]